MSSIMRARSGLTGRWEGPEVIGGSFLELKVAGPSMLGIGRPDRHALPRITSSKMRRPQRLLPSRERVRSSAHKRQPSDHDPLDFIEAHFIAPTVVKLRRTS
jgi:hypothetical protein